MALDDDLAPTSTKKGGFLSHMQVQAAVRATHTTKSSSESVATNDTPAETSLASPGVPVVVDTLECQLLPRLVSLWESSSPFISAPSTQAPATITTVDTTTLDPFSELSKIEPDEELGRPKSSVPKGKQKGTRRNPEAGPSKHRSGRKKAGNNA